MLDFEIHVLFIASTALRSDFQIAKSDVLYLYVDEKVEALLLLLC